MAALSPQFVFEVPESVEQEEAKRVAASLRRLRLTETASTPATSDSLSRNSQESAHEETRKGLMRLSQLIRNKKSGNSKKIESKESDRKERDERRKQRALAVYRSVEGFQDPMAGRGVIVDRIC